MHEFGHNAQTSPLISGGCQSLRFESSTRPVLPCHVFVPSEQHSEQRVLVSVHGVSRNVEEHIELLRPYANKYGVVLIAPMFADDRFRDYQRLGRKAQGPRADLALIRLLNELGRLIGVDTSCVDMFGFSGGAQFVHRFAMAHPIRVRRLSLGAAGWYTMPDKDLPYPYGVGDPSGLDAVRLNIAAAARLQTLVLVGEKDDCAEDEELNRSKRICRSQGDNRRQRAQSWTSAMKAYSSGKGEPANTRMVVLPGVDHSFREAVLHGNLGAHVFAHCYSAEGAGYLQQPLRSLRTVDCAGGAHPAIQSMNESES